VNLLMLAYIVPRENTVLKELPPLVEIAQLDLIVLLKPYPTLPELHAQLVLTTTMQEQSQLPNARSALWVTTALEDQLLRSCVHLVPLVIKSKLVWKSMMVFQAPDIAHPALKVTCAILNLSLLPFHVESVTIKL
jgi:hypothetical protein